MGVKGLWWFLKGFRYDDQTALFNSVDLVQKASESPSGITLIVDFYAFEYWVMAQVFNYVVDREKFELNPWMTVSGGEYSFYGECVTKTVTALKELGINLIFVANTGRCSTIGQTDLKYSRWLRTDGQDMKKIHDLIQLLEESDSTTNKCDGAAWNRETKAPSLLQVEIIERLLQAGCEVLCSPDGEADPYIAQLYFERRAFAILSNDSDFLLFENCCYINLDEHFDLTHQLGDLFSANSKLLELQVKCIDSKDVYWALNLRNIDAACDLSFILGNDISKQFPDLYKQLKLSRFSVPGVAARLRKFGPVSSNPEFLGVLSDPRIKEAYRLTHELYKMELNFDDEDNEPFDDSGVELEKSVVMDAIVNCRIAGQCLPLSRGFYWQDAKVVESTENNDSIESICLPLRLALYKMLMLKGKGENNQIVEFQPLHKSMETVKRTFCLEEIAEKYRVDIGEIPRYSEIAEMSRKRRLDLFDHIATNSFSNEKTDVQEKIFEQFDDWPIAFRVYVCRFVWLANGGDSNLKMSKSEMESVIAMVFTIFSRMDYLELGINAGCRPTRRSLTVGSFVQIAYRYLYFFFAKLLNLADLKESGLPLPSSFFCGSLFTAMYMCAENKGDGDCYEQTSRLQQVKLVRSQILDKFSTVVDAVFQ